jgi:hypothetical protein
MGRKKAARFRRIKWSRHIAFAAILLVSSLTFGYEVVKYAQKPDPAPDTNFALPEAPVGTQAPDSAKPSGFASGEGTLRFSPAAEPAAVPEPSALVLLIAATPLFLIRRRARAA